MVPRGAGRLLPTSSPSPSPNPRRRSSSVSPVRGDSRREMNSILSSAIESIEPSPLVVYNAAIRLRVAGLGHFMEIDVEPNITPGDLKYIIESKTDLPAPYQRLVAKRKKMDDDTMVLGQTVMDGNTIVSMGIGLEDRTKILMLHSPMYAKDKDGIEKLTELNKEIEKIELGRNNRQLNNKTVQELIIQIMCKIDCVETNGSEALRKMRKLTIKQAEGVAHKSEDIEGKTLSEDFPHESKEGNTALDGMEIDRGDGNAGAEVVDVPHGKKYDHTGAEMEENTETQLLKSSPFESENEKETTEKLANLMKEIERIDIRRRNRDLDNKTVQELIIQVMCKIDCVETHGMDVLRKMRKATIKRAEAAAHESEKNKRGVDP